jgi:hypothetical protein
MSSKTAEILEKKAAAAEETVEPTHKVYRDKETGNEYVFPATMEVDNPNYEDITDQKKPAEGTVAMTPLTTAAPPTEAAAPAKAGPSTRNAKSSADKKK